ncbi:MAG: hypothetical protein VYA30_02050 [Myxococcota bacterium]|nr:hypothetical protein [Myxococcota bacterium]
MRSIRFFMVFVLFTSFDAEAALPDDRTGFMLRFHGGAGYSETSRDLGGHIGILSVKGASGFAQFAVGGFIIPNLALHATFFGFEASEPTIEDARGERHDSEAVEVTFSLQAAGIGLTYYLMPANVYFSASLGMGKAVLEVSDGNRSVEDRSKDGFCSTASIAKEWSVSSSWSLGVGGQFNYALIPVGIAAECIGSCDQDMQSLSGGVFFSATYN